MEKEINEYKKKLRKEMQIKRNELTMKEVLSLSEQIAVRIEKSDLFKKYENICIYKAFRHEVYCDSIMRKALLAGKKVYAPVTDMEHMTMEFYQITRMTEWRTGAYNIQEPVLTKETSVLQSPSLLLMPGLLFDYNKHRIGYGGGYYDKYLETHKEHTTMALCYSFQIMEKDLPCEEHDILPDYIVTEQEIF